MNVVRSLNAIASGTSAVYRIVITGLLLFEVFRYGLRSKRNAQAYTDRDHRGSR